MADGDFFLVGRCVAREADHFHAVQQRPGDRVRPVCRADEQHIRQVIGHIHIVVGKGVVLLGVEDFKQGTCRVAVVGSGELVHFVENHHRVGHA